MQLHPAAFRFLEAINDHNTRKFFATARPLYDEIRKNLNDICSAVIAEVSNFDPDVADLKPKDCMFRIYRDARRLQEWDSIYKHNRWFVLSPWWKNSSLPWYYFHLEPGNKSFFGWWVYRPDPAHLRNLRHYLSKHGDKYKKILSKAAFKKNFWTLQWASLTRPPLGFKPYTPYLEYVQRKQHLIYAHISDDDIMSCDIVKLFVTQAKAAHEWISFLREGCI